MVEFNTEKELNIASTDVMTGDRNRERFLYYQLKMSMQQAKKIDINYCIFFDRIRGSDELEGFEGGFGSRRTNTFADRQLSGDYAALGTVFD